MSVDYNTTLKTNRMQLVADLVSGKVAASSTGSATAGYLVIGDSTLNGSSSSTTGVLVKFTLNSATGTVSNISGNIVLTLSGTPISTSATGTGTAAKAELWSNSGSTSTQVIVSGLTVGTTTQNIVINATAISSGQSVTLSSGTITHG
jgi:hypothetical protein